MSLGFSSYLYVIPLNPRKSYSSLFAFYGLFFCFFFFEKYDALLSRLMLVVNLVKKTINLSKNGLIFRQTLSIRFVTEIKPFLMSL